jgi:hypothetical protein
MRKIHPLTVDSGAAYARCILHDYLKLSEHPAVSSEGHRQLRRQNGFEINTVSTVLWLRNCVFDSGAFHAKQRCHDSQETGRDYRRMLE